MLPPLPGNRMFANSNLIRDRGGEGTSNSLILSSEELLPVYTGKKRSPYLFVGRAKSWMRFVALAASVFGWIRAYGAGTFLRTDTEFAAQCAAGVTRFERENPVRAEVSIGGAYRPRTRNYSRWIVFFGNVFRSRHHFDSLRGAPPQR